MIGVKRQINYMQKVERKAAPTNKNNLISYSLFLIIKVYNYA